MARKGGLTFLAALTPDFFDSAYLAAGEADFDAVRVGGGTGEDIFDNAFGQFSGYLVLLQNYRDA